MTTLQNNDPDARAQLYLEYRAKGLTYEAVADVTGADSGEAVRSSIRRYNRRKDTPTIESSSQQFPFVDDNFDTDDGLFSLDSPESDLEIWFIDIERFPRIEYSWSAKKYTKFTPEYLLVEEGRMISFAAKKLGGTTVFSSEFHHGRENMLSTLWHVLDRADIVVGWNSRKFDVPHMDGELRDAGFPVYRPFKQIDLYLQIRSRFNYDYNTMKSIAKRWDLEDQKMENEGFDLWKRCMANDDDAWDIMRKYNMQDVRTTEAAYLSNLQWLSGSLPNLGMWVPAKEGELVCPACGSKDIDKDGTASTNAVRYVAYRCNRCGHRSRSNERVAVAPLRTITR